MEWASLDEIKEANAKSGLLFFHPDTMRALGSRVYQTLYGGRFFVTSELDFDGNRRWHVRMARPDARIITVDDVNNGYENHVRAASRARELSGGSEQESD